MKKEVKEIIKKIEKAGWNVNVDDEYRVTLQIFTPARQDFFFTVETENNEDTFIDNIYDYYENFDVSYQTYLWLDSEGHGRSGAPYDMRDLYNDMETCEHLILKLYDCLTTQQ